MSVKDKVFRLFPSRNGGGYGQFSPLDTGSYQNIDSPTQILKGGAYRIKSVNSADCWVKITEASEAAASNEGALIDSEITVTIPDGWYVSSTSKINVVPWRG